MCISSICILSAQFSFERRMTLFLEENLEPKILLAVISPSLGRNLLGGGKEMLSNECTLALSQKNCRGYFSISSYQMNAHRPERFLMFVWDEQWAVSSWWEKKFCNKEFVEREIHFEKYILSELWAAAGLWEESFVIKSLQREKYILRNTF